ncbi:lycopene cyclase family protein [Actinacidiphila paucisporea]|uniref:Lycopene beta-cyclase n=1 Tax=Actinacidiphila paucisporea TaxID=310782 RepID=A0A1M7PW80_9ACTN|nr:lycopene cyclase family protein [Actinacidiphila paucisporea]SHN21861.1 lycopene beta-cyclase [Actinacidiphila paucisporea]
MRDADVVIVGAGAAGLSLARMLCAAEGGAPTSRALSVVLVDAPRGPLRPPERTWCFWEPPGGPYDAHLAASWERLRVRGPDGAQTVGRPRPYRYKMLRARDFEALVGGELAASRRCRRVEAVVDSVHDHADGAVVRGRDAAGQELALRARWVFDSRPPRRLPPARTTLLQHFRGWFVRTDRPAFDPTVADLMDFRTPQPAQGLSFGYVLPLSADRALIEYTEFSREVLDTDGYERALRGYTRDVLRLGEPDGPRGAGGFRVTAVEQGVIPMTDGRFERRAGRSVFRIGTAGGATRASTGYTFAAVQRQTRAVAEALAAGRTPLPPSPHSRRSQAMDAVMLRVLDSGRVDGARFFTSLFAGVPMERLLRFLDGGCGLREDVSIGLRTPVAPMVRTVAELPFLRRRSPPPPGGPW